MIKFIHDESSRISNTYAPGTAAVGMDGDDGMKGTDGNSVFFTNYEIDNSYYKDLCLQRIDSGICLSNDKGNTVGKSYVFGDLIITPSKSVFMLCENHDSNSNHKFGIKNIGRIRYGNDYSNTLYEMISGVKIKLCGEADANVNGYSRRQLLGMDPSTWPSKCISEKIDISVGLIESEIFENYEASIEICIKNRKAVYGEHSPILENDTYVEFPYNGVEFFDFYKKLEIPLVNGEKCLYAETLITEDVCDKLMPVGNGISSTYRMPDENTVIEYYDSGTSLRDNDGRERMNVSSRRGGSNVDLMWYSGEGIGNAIYNESSTETGVGSGESSQHEQQGSEYVQVENSDVTMPRDVIRRFKKSAYTYYNASTRIPRILYVDTSKNIDYEFEKIYGAKLEEDIKKFKEGKINDILDTLYISQRNSYVKKPESGYILNSINYVAGESAHFTGMVDPSLGTDIQNFNQFITACTLKDETRTESIKSYVSEEIGKMITSNENIFTLILRNKANGLLTRIELSSSSKPITIE